MDDEAPVVLRHRDAHRQAVMYGAFALLLLGLPFLGFLNGHPGRWWLAALTPLGLLLAYAALRLLTLRVELAEDGVREPAALRRTVLTPWDDVVRVRRTEEDRAMGLRFLGVSIEHRGGWKHDLVALTINTRDPLAEKTVNEWVSAIRDARKSRLGAGSGEV